LGWGEFEGSAVEGDVDDIMERMECNEMRHEEVEIEGRDNLDNTNV
jgi:hypothetical protein